MENAYGFDVDSVLGQLRAHLPQNGRLVLQNDIDFRDSFHGYPRVEFSGLMASSLLAILPSPLTLTIYKKFLLRAKRSFIFPFRGSNRAVWGYGNREHPGLGRFRGASVGPIRRFPAPCGGGVSEPRLGFRDGNQAFDRSPRSFPWEFHARRSESSKARQWPEPVYPRNPHRDSPDPCRPPGKEV